MIAPRDWYLATLGIVRYVPRGSVVAQEVGDTLAPATPSAKQGRAALRQLLADEMPAERRPTVVAPAAESTRGTGNADRRPESTPKPDVVSATPADRQPRQRSGQAQLEAQTPTRLEPGAVEQDETIEVRLAVWQPAPDLIVFDSLQAAAQPSIQMARLVTNIAAALGRSAESGATPQLLDWPPAHSRAESGLEAARTMVSAFCDARFSDSTPTSDTMPLVLILGGDAVRLLLPDQPASQEGSEDGSLLTLRWRERDTVVAPSLSDMLGNPSIKRRVWQTLAPLAPR